MTMDPDALYLFGGIAASAAAVLGAIAHRRARACERLRRAHGVDDTAPTSRVRRWLAPLAVHLRPTSIEEREQLATRLAQAGRRGRDAVDRHAQDRLLALFLAGIAALLLAVAVRGAAGALLAAGAIAAGVLGPGWLMAMRASARRDAVDAALPGAIDLLTTCIDAGLALEQAIARVARELAATSPVLAAELGLTAGEIDAGIASADALRRLARRVGLDDLSAMCGVIAQAHGLGAPIGDTLREFAAASRRARTSQLEERAGKLAAQLTIPLATCLLPAALLVILGPAVLQLVRALQ
jgi:tight adherence protein C